MRLTSFEWAGESECRDLLKDIAQDAQDECSMDLAAEAVGLIVDIFPARDMNNPEMFLEYAVMSLCGFPSDVVVKMAHPSYGIARTVKFLPSIAEMVQWCEAEVDARAAAAEAAKRRLAVLAERQRLMKGPIVNKPRVLGGWRKPGQGGTK